MVVLAITLCSRFWWFVAIMFYSHCVCQFKLLWVTYFQPEEFPLTISCKGGLLPMDSLHFYFSGNVFYFVTFNFERWFCWIKDSGWWVCGFSPLSTLNMSFYFLLAPLFLMRKHLLLWLPCTWLVIFLFLLSRFSVGLCTSNIFYYYVYGCGPFYTILLGIGWTSWRCRFVFLIKFEKLSTIISSNFFSTFFSLFSPVVLPLRTCQCA